MGHRPRALFCRRSCMGGCIPEISTLHPVANADALKGVDKTPGQTNLGATILKTGTNSWICLFDFGHRWRANIPAVYLQESSPIISRSKAHSILALSGMTGIQITWMSCGRRTLKDANRLRPNLCLQTHHGFDGRVSSVVLARQ